MKVHIVGLGGVGFHLVTALCGSVDPTNLICYDNDSLAGGLGHTRLPKADLSTKKTDLSKGHLLINWGVTSLPKYVTDWFTGKEPNAGDLVVDCCDADRTPRQAFWDKAQKNGARCIRVSYDGKNGTVTVAGGLPIMDVEKGGYDQVPTLGLSFMAGGIGAEVVRQILLGHDEFVEFQVCLADLGAWKKDKEPPVVREFTNFRQNLPRKQKKRRSSKPVSKVA